jgi:hypothetical protein
MMDEQQFKDHYIATFLASYMAVNHESDCLHGHPNQRYNHQPIEDAIFCAECAWKQLKELE